MVDCGSTELRRGLLHVELRHLEQIEGLVADVEAKPDGLAATDRRTVLVSTIPGIAQRTAEVIVTALDDAGRFKTGRPCLRSRSGLGDVARGSAR